MSQALIWRTLARRAGLAETIPGRGWIGVFNAFCGIVKLGFSERENLLGGRENIFIMTIKCLALFSFFDSVASFQYSYTATMMEIDI